MKTRGLSTFVLAGVILAVLLLLVFRLLPSSKPDTAAVLLPTPTPQPVTSPVPEEPAAEVVQVSALTVQAVLGSLERASDYTRTLTLQRYWQGGDSAEEILVYHTPEKTAMEVTTVAGRVRHILLDGSTTAIWYGDAGPVYTGPRGERDADLYQGVQTYEDLLTLDPQAIVRADYVSYEGEGCIVAEYIAGPYDYRSLLYVSVRTGLLMGSETYDGDRLILRVASTQPELGVPDESHFARPA